MNNIINIPKTGNSGSLDRANGAKNTSSVKQTQKSQPPGNKESLKVASDKAIKSQSSKNKATEETLTNVLTHGLNYFKEVRKQAQEDRAKGVKPIQGAKDLWSQLNTQANKIGQDAQDKVLDDFVKQSGTIIADSVKRNQIDNLGEDLLGTGNSVGTTSKAEAGSTIVGAEGNVASTVATKVPQTTGTATAAGVANKIVGGVGAAYSLYQLYNTFGHSSPVEGAMNGATVGAYAGSFFGPVGTAVGGVLGAVVGAGLGLINNRKHPETVQRDQMRAGLAEYGFVDKDYNIKLADGTNYSIATDSQRKLIGQDGAERFGYQIDFSNPLAGKAIALTQPLAEVLTGGHDKLKTDLIGYLVNAATSNATSAEEVKANVLSFYEQSKLSNEDLAGSLSKLTNENKISQEEIQVYANDLSTFFEPDVGTVDSSELLAA